MAWGVRDVSLWRLQRLGDEGLEVGKVTENRLQRRFGGKEAVEVLNKNVLLNLFTSEPPFKK
jgi:hypothetical protein